jgi:hypothetical protein
MNALRRICINLRARVRNPSPPLTKRTAVMASFLESSHKDGNTRAFHTSVSESFAAHASALRLDTRSVSC